MPLCPSSTGLMRSPRRFISSIVSQQLCLQWIPHITNSLACNPTTLSFESMAASVFHGSVPTTNTSFKTDQLLVSFLATHLHKVLTYVSNLALEEYMFHAMSALMKVSSLLLNQKNHNHHYQPHPNQFLSMNPSPLK